MLPAFSSLRYSSLIGKCRLPVRRCPVQALRPSLHEDTNGHRYLRHFNFRASSAFELQVGYTRAPQDRWHRRSIAAHETTMTQNTQQAPAPVSLGEAFRYWLKLGFISFGGPTGQIAIMHQQLVEKRRWISEKRFLHALNYCMLLPGPEATQLATYIGWMMHRTCGGIIAGVLFVLPSMFILMALTWIYLVFGKVPLVAG